MGQILLHLLYLAAHSFLFAEALHMLVGIGEKFNKEENWGKYVTVGWGKFSLLSINVVNSIFTKNRTWWLNW